jgi:hypothetical protein
MYGFPFSALACEVQVDVSARITMQGPGSRGQVVKKTKLPGIISRAVLLPVTCVQQAQGPSDGTRKPTFTTTLSIMQHRGIRRQAFGQTDFKGASTAASWGSGAPRAGALARTR